MSTEQITIFTDGAARGNPGPGGWGAVLVGKLGSSEVKEIGGREAHTTNNRMELMAAIEGLEALKRFNLSPDLRLNLYSDSTYIVLGMTEWAARWQRNGWKTANKKRVENQDLWERLLAVSQDKKIEWKRIDGHADTAGNIRADEIATAFADNEKPKLYSGVLENYRIKNVLNVSSG